MHSHRRNSVLQTKHAEEDRDEAGPELFAIYHTEEGDILDVFHWDPFFFVISFIRYERRGRFLYFFNSVAIRLLVGYLGVDDTD